MRSISEDGFIDGSSLAQMLTATTGNSTPQNMTVATFNDVDRIDLKIAKMFDRRADRVGTAAERLRLIEALRAKPDPPRDALAKGDRRLRTRRSAWVYIGRIS